MKEEYENAYLVVEPPVARLVLNRPEKLNAINAALMADSMAALDVVEERDDVTVLVVEGEGRAFCTGYDLVEVTERFTKKYSDFPIHEEREYIRDQAWGWHRLWELNTATIAKVHGYALAGGLMIAGNCDIVIAAEDARLGQPEVKTIGFNPEIGLWPFTIGPRMTKELLFTGRAVTGTEAAEMGMINDAVPADELDAAVDDIVSDITELDRDMLLYAKRMVNDVYEQMGMGSMIRTGINYDMLGHLCESRDRFKKLVDEEGLEAAIAAEFPSTSQDLKND